MPGPPSNPNASRRNVRVGPVRLPSSGRTGRAPRWPLPVNPRLVAKIEIEHEAIAELEERELENDGLTGPESARLTRARQRLKIAEVTARQVDLTEKALWRDLWKTPHAVQWELLGWTREVAQYVRWKAAAECGDLDAGKEARQYADRLGLNPKAMRMLMWTIADDEITEARKDREADKAAQSRRRTIKAVDTTGS